MTNGGSLEETLWRDLIADDLEDWLSRHEVFKDPELVEYVRTGKEEKVND